MSEARRCSRSAALGAAIAVYWLGDRALLGMLDARPFALAEDPLLRSATDRVAAQLRVAPPKLCLIDDGFPRAFVVGRGPGGATLAVSTGLLRVVRRDELEAVIAHELAHVRSLDVLTQMFAVLLATTLVEASRLGGFLSRALLFVLGPVAAAFTHALLSPRREYAADRDAASVCDPHDLADALLRLDQAAELVVVRRVAGDRAALPRRPVRARPALPDVPHAPAARRAGAAAAGARRRTRPAGGRRAAPGRLTPAGADRRRKRRGARRCPSKRKRDTLSCVPFRI